MSDLVAIPYRVIDGSLCTVSYDPANLTPRPLTPFLHHQCGERQWWLLDADYLRHDGKHVIRMRRGFGWNGTSGGWAVHLIEGPEDHLPATNYHDGAYTYHWLEVWDADRQAWVSMECGKHYADRLYYQISRELKARLVKAFFCWRTLHLWGWFAWWSGVCPRSCSPCPSTSGPGQDCPYRGSLPIFATKKLE